MRFQGIATLLLVAGLSTAVMLACSSPDPGEIQYGERVFAPNGGAGGSTTSSGAASSTSSSSGGDGGTATAIFAGAYVATAAGNDSTAVARHGQAGLVGNNPAGVDCLKCHSAASADPNKSTKIFRMGGTVYVEGGATAAAEKVEIEIVDSAGKRVAQAYTDKGGNFFVEGADAIPAGSIVGVRDGAKKGVMKTPISSGACGSGSCHVTTLKIELKNY